MTLMTNDLNDHAPYIAGTDPLNGASVREIVLMEFLRNNI